MRTDQQPVRIALFAPEGRMGRAIYARLTENGHEVMAWDRDARAIKSAAEHQARLADSPRAVAVFGAGGVELLERLETGDDAGELVLARADVAAERLPAGARAGRYR